MAKSFGWLFFGGRVQGSDLCYREMALLGSYKINLNREGLEARKMSCNATSPVQARRLEIKQ